METGAIVSLQKGDEMTGQMVDGRCNSCDWDWSLYMHMLYMQDIHTWVSCTLN